MKFLIKMKAWIKESEQTEKQRVPMIVVIGDNEVENNMIALRDRRNREQKILQKMSLYN